MPLQSGAGSGNVGAQCILRNHPPRYVKVEVRRLINPDMLVEIEADAVIE
jgi:enamine deaminase RidA (YjgF/YER057c/UK114 family)